MYKIGHCSCRYVTCFLVCSQSLQFYRGSNYDITDELSQILELSETKTLLNKNKSGCATTLKRIFSSAFGKPFLMVGVIRILNQWGESHNLMINMIQIFRDSNSSIEPELAPVFVAIVQVHPFSSQRWTSASFRFLLESNILNKNKLDCLEPKKYFYLQVTLFTFYTVPSSVKLKGTLVHYSTACGDFVLEEISCFKTYFWSGIGRTHFKLHLTSCKTEKSLRHLLLHRHLGRLLPRDLLLPEGQLGSR